jgi:hypothetical protein
VHQRSPLPCALAETVGFGPTRPGLQRIHRHFRPVHSATLASLPRRSTSGTLARIGGVVKRLRPERTGSCGHDGRQLAEGPVSDLASNSTFKLGPVQQPNTATPSAASGSAGRLPVGRPAPTTTSNRAAESSHRGDQAGVEVTHDLGAGHDGAVETRAPLGRRTGRRR